MPTPFSRIIERREFQRQLIDELRNTEVATLDDSFFEAIERSLNKLFPAGKRTEMAREWVDELVLERILIRSATGPDGFQLNPDPIVGETARERFEKLPADISERRMPASLLALYAANSFLFLILSFFFLPDSFVKVLGSAAGVALGVFGLKSLNPRESSSGPRLLQRRLVGAALALATLVQGILLVIGFTNPCRIFAIPGSTVFVDGKFLERTSEPPEQERRDAKTLNSPENIRPWLKPRENRHFLRWETHEIKITKKWYVDSDRSQESVQNVSVNFGKFLDPKEAFNKWRMESEQKPYLKIDYGGLGRPSGDVTPSLNPDSTLPSEALFAESELRKLVEEWDLTWTAALDQTDVIGHKRTEPYVAGIQMVQDRSILYFDFQIRDWTNKPVKPLQPIRPTSASIRTNSQVSNLRSFPSKEELKQLLAESLREQIFGHLLDELGIPERIKTAPTAEKLVSLTQKLNTEVEKSVTTPTPSPTTTPASSPAVAAGSSATPIPNPSPFPSPALSPVIAATPTPSLLASASPPTTTVKELERVATDAVENDRLDVAVSAQQQLKTAFNQVTANPYSIQSTRLKNELMESQQVVENAIKNKAIKDKTDKGRVYIHIADELQREHARAIQDKLKEAHFAVVGIQNVGGRAYIPDTAEVRFFAYPDPPLTKQAADEIVELLKKAGVLKPRSSYVIPSARERQGSMDITTHFEIWFARDSSPGKTAN